MGVSAAGKSVTGTALASRLSLPFVDGDDLHPAANVAKMHGGTPLTDDDRWPWLDQVGAELSDVRRYPEGVIVACSALRSAYRDRIRRSAASGLRFVFLNVGKKHAHRRSAARHGHFMPPSLIDSQFTTLELPDGEPDVLTVPSEGTPGQVADTIAALLRNNRLGASVDR